MMKLLPIILAATINFSAAAQTLIFPVSDLLMQIPTFDNAPDFSMMNWGNPIGEKGISPERKKLEAELIELMWEEYPDAKSIRIFRGNLIVRL